MQQYTRTNTPFFGRTYEGRLAVYLHYTQGATVITMLMAEAKEVSPGVFVRDNKSAGTSRFPRRYLTDHAALALMVGKSIRDDEFSTDQTEVVVAHDRHRLSSKNPAEVANYRFQMQTRDRLQKEQAEKRLGEIAQTLARLTAEESDRIGRLKAETARIEGVLARLTPA